MNNFSRQAKIISHVKAFIEHNYYNRGLTLGLTAVYFNMNRDYLGKQELLIADNRKITDIAFKVGYRSLEHFNRIFRKLENTTPSEFKSLIIKEKGGERREVTAITSYVY
jgi:AraC-like DNA-binding protein